VSDRVTVQVSLENITVEYHKDRAQKPGSLVDMGTMYILILFQLHLMAILTLFRTHILLLLLLQPQSTFLTTVLPTLHTIMVEMEEQLLCLAMLLSEYVVTHN